jgi:hypothetical protein
MELYDRHAHADRHWFEKELSYDNARLSQALIVSGRATGQEEVLHRGLKTLRWLTEQQTTEKGQLRPIGSNGFYHRGGGGPTSTSSPSRHRPQSRPVSKLIGKLQMCNGTSRRNAPSTGSSDAMIWVLNSTYRRRAVVTIDCTRTGSMETRGLNPRWPSYCRWWICARCKTSSPASSSRSRRRNTLPCPFPYTRSAQVQFL